VRLLIVRHGRTEWNEQGRIQGRTDTELSPAGRRQVQAWRLPEAFRAARCVASPLRRALETARLLGHPASATDARLAEMRWGAFEGRLLAELRAERGTAMEADEALGLDFRPPGGESPREVAARLSDFLVDAARQPVDLLVVAHKGILRASLVLALGWDMLGRPPVPLEEDTAFEHRLEGGRPSFVRTVDLLGGGR
jgi:broad specificity phosphatase PhoE